MFTIFEQTKHLFSIEHLSTTKVQKERVRKRLVGATFCTRVLVPLFPRLRVHRCWISYDLNHFFRQLCSSWKLYLYGNRSNPIRHQDSGNSFAWMVRSLVKSVSSRAVSNSKPGIAPVSLRWWASEALMHLCFHVWTYLVTVGVLGWLNSSLHNCHPTERDGAQSNREHTLKQTCIWNTGRKLLLFDQWQWEPFWCLRFCKIDSGFCSSHSVK